MMMPLFVATLVLAAVYGALRWYLAGRGGARRAGGTAERIDVVAARRLGPRQQLLIVRALNQELLLAVEGGRMRRLAVRRFEAVAGAAEGLADESRDERDVSTFVEKWSLGMLPRKGLLRVRLPELLRSSAAVETPESALDVHVAEQRALAAATRGTRKQARAKQSLAPAPVVAEAPLANAISLNASMADESGVPAAKRKRRPRREDTKVVESAAPASRAAAQSAAVAGILRLRNQGQA